MSILYRRASIYLSKERAQTKLCTNKEGKEREGIQWNIGNTDHHERGGQGVIESKIRTTRMEVQVGKRYENLL